ncbi:MAG: alpha-ketoacid dehydrogenase subunit alpha/beta [Planctomycetota bacterium]
MMQTIRLFEETLLRLFRDGELRGTTHVCLGQEAVATGACAGLAPQDKVTSNHRGHGHILARGADPNRVMAELFGKRDGYSQGLGGSQHMAAQEVGFLGSNGITGGGLPIATGAALSSTLLEQEAVVLAFFGDGASAQGTFHESLNLAGVWKLPVIFLCENNQYAMGTPLSETCPADCIADRAKGYGIPSVQVDGNDVLAVRDAVRRARAHAAEGGGPILIEALTWRQTGHSRSDPCEYVPDEYQKEALQRDPIVAFEQVLSEAGAKPSALEDCQRGAKEVIDAAVEFARKSPPLDPCELPGRVFSDASPPPITKTTPAQECTYAEALRFAMADALRADPSVVLLGEDIADYNGAFRVTGDLYQTFGTGRVRNTPISENTIVGCSTGAAMTGLRPVAEIMFMDFLLLALDQLINHAAKFRFIYGGQFSIPLTVRTPAGGRRGYGATHSQCFEPLLMSVPGLKVFCPATVQDAYDLLSEAIQTDDPVVVIEHKLLYGSRGTLDPKHQPLPSGKARILQTGEDLTIISYSHMTQLALEAAAALEEAGISTEVIDLRTLAPLDMETITESAARTGRVLVAEEGHITGGVGAELVARIQEVCFGYLDAPVLRVGAQDMPMPTARPLEEAVLPQVSDLLDAAKRLLED